VQPGVARTTRVCTYDRAGMGYSDSGPLPRTAKQFARELHTLLLRADVPGPYVLVGHSLGGLPVRVFTNDYPTDVVGVVLIDSMSPSSARSSASDTRPNRTHRPSSIGHSRCRRELVCYACRPGRSS
jgi:pimeloyl-ACP methyl ester carboxylesterase